MNGEFQIVFVVPGKTVETCAREQHPVKIMPNNNRTLGMGRRRKRGKVSEDCPFNVGYRVTGIRTGDPKYDGQIFTVDGVDESDQTIQLDCNFEPWVSWLGFAVVEEIGWEWLRKQLPAEALDLLSAFDGVETLKLKPAIKDLVVRRQPDLKNVLVRAVMELEESSF